MKIDLEARALSVSVRELVAPNQRAPIGFASQWRTRLGTRAHAAYGRQVTEAADGATEQVQTEVPIEMKRAVLDFTCTVRGRVDVVRRGDDVIVVEEVKSVLGRPGDETLHRAMFQARLYALALELETGTRTRAEVVLYSLVDGATEALDARYVREDAIADLDAAIGVIVEEVLQSAELAARRVAAADALRFPFADARDHQLELIDILADALESNRPVLAAAPTGIGKTVTTLLPALRHALRHDATVFYLTAKTTQRRLVGDTFEKICAASPEADYPLRALTLRSRAQMCPPGDLRCHPELCPLLRDFERRCEETKMVDRLLEATHLAPEVVYAEGEAAKLCPYELTMRAAERVDVIIGDYNHLFDQRATPAGLMTITERVVVLDEAHNLFDRARGYYSPFVGRRIVRAALEATRRAEPPALAMQIDRWCEAVLDVVGAAARARREGEGSMDGCFPVRIDVEEWENLAEEGELLGARHAQERYLRATVRSEDPILELVAEVSQLADLAASRDEELVGYASTEEGEQGLGLGIVCVDPARRLERVHRRALGTLAVSATMAPLAYFSEVLGLARLDPVLTSAPSPFPFEQRCVRICPDVSTTYRERDGHAPMIAQRIGETYRARPGRYIAFFSSFAFAGTVRKHLDVSPSEVLVQLPAGGHAARSLILRQLKQRDRALLLAVMGGVFGEGIDLPGDELIGAIVVGPGLPPVSFERLAMQHYFSERHDNGFAYAMIYPGLQRVIQAAGRVIRTMDDAGVIVLLGRRFAESDYIDCLPEHWYRHRAEELISDDLPGDLAAFWESM